VSSQQDLAANREVFRSGGSFVLWWVWVVIAIVALIDLAIQAHSHSALVMAVLVVAITGAVYACALRPRIVADAGGITVENPLRDHRVPWGAVEKVDAVNAVGVHCVAAPGAGKGKTVHSWAVQSSPRSAQKAQYRARRAQAGHSAGYGRYPAEAQEALRRTLAESTALQLNERARRERAAGAAAGQPETRWAWAPIAAMAVPLAVLIVVVLV
jgi:hypothetical protein